MPPSAAPSVATASPMPPPPAAPWSEHRAALRPIADTQSPAMVRAGASGRTSRSEARDVTVTAATGRSSPMPPPLVPASPRRTPAHMHSYSIAAPGAAAAAAAGSPNRQPATPSRHKVSRSLGSFPVTPDGRFDSPASPSPSRAPSRPVLPAHPADWSPSELAQYLSYSLRTGGSDGTGPTLPSLVVEDVISWVLRSRVTGKQFISSSQGFSGSRPPPFFPVLQSLSRRLARNVRHGRRLSDASEASGIGNRNNDDSDGAADVTRVRRLAHAFEAASEVGSDDAPLSALRAQVTGNSVEGFGRATPKYGSSSASWSRTRRDSETSSVVSAAPSQPVHSGPRWRQRRDSNASAVSAISGVSAISASANVPRWRQEVAGGSPPRSVSNPTGSPPRSVSNPLHPSPVRSPHSPSPSPGPSPKSQLRGLGAVSPISPLQPISERPVPSQAVPVAATAPDDPFTDREVRVTGASPPPPYENAFPPSLLVPEAPRTPEGTGASSRSASATPLRPEVHVSPHLSPHAHHFDAYANLRRGPGRPRAYSDETEESDTSDDDSSEAKPRAGDHWSTTRVVTLRPKTPKTFAPPSPALKTLAPPSPALKTPAPASAHTTPGSRRRRVKREMEREVTALTDRIKELEARLSAVETPPVLSPAADNAPLNALPYDSPQNERMPSDGAKDDSARDLPLALFLVGLGVGVGVSAVVARVLMSRRAA